MRIKVLLFSCITSLLIAISPAAAMMHGHQAKTPPASQSNDGSCTMQSSGKSAGAAPAGQGGDREVPGPAPQSAASKRSAPKAESAKQPTESTPATGKSAATPSEKALTEKESVVEAPPSMDTSRTTIPIGAEGPTLNWKDEMVMHRVPTQSSAEGPSPSPGKPHPFYMDETQVTNHQYVEFLNKVLPRIQVENGVVKGDGKIWLLLGEVEDGYEPIVFENGRFVVNGPHHAACAVLRVTASGASAYADFYGKRLPTPQEWSYAAHTGGSSLQQLPIPSPVVLYKPNDYGIRGLYSNIGEWGVQAEGDSSGKAGSEAYVVMRMISNRSAPVQSQEATIHRYAWEAFADVGFRTVLPVPEEPSK